MNIKDKYLTYENVRKNIIYAILLIVFISFHKLFETLITENLVIPFFSKFNSDWYTVLFFFLIVIYFSFRFCYLLKYRFKPSTVQIILLLISTLIYFNYRSSENIWTYDSVFWKVKYFDLIPVITFFEWTLFIISLNFPYKHSLNKDGKDTIAPFFLDKELSGSDADLLGRENLARQIVSKIESTVSVTSFAIGIIGKWGAGKTSFLYLIRRNLNPGKVIVINFNPWNSSSSKTIVNDFFDVVSSELSKYDGTIKSRLNDYSRKLLDVYDTSLMKFLSLISKTLFYEKTLEDKKQEINSVIKGIGKQLIIFIDDVDRLDANEVIEVIRLIRNNANFENTFFVVGYDREYVNKAIRGITDHNSHFFLEKIFQLEVVLPVYEYKILGRVLYAFLKNATPQHYHRSIEETMFINGNSNEEPMLGLLENIRDVIRFSNSFALSFNALKGEVVPFDLFRIECLKIKFPSVYTLLYEKRHNLFVNSEKDYFFDENIYTLKRDELDPKATILGTILNENFFDYGLAKGDCNNVVQFVDGVFSKKFSIDDNYYYPNLSIRYSKGFNRYFANRLLIGELSENEFSSAVLLAQTEFNEKIFDWVANGLRDEIRHRFEMYKDFSDRSQFEKIINGIFYFGNIPINGKIGDYRGFDDSNLFDKLSDYGNRITKKYYNGNVEEYRIFLISLLTDISLNQPMEREFASYLMKKPEIDLPISQEELYEIVLDSLKKYLTTKDDFTNFKFEYFYDCQLFALDETGQYVKGIPQSAKLAMMEFVDNCFDSFIVRIIEEAPFDENWFKINQFMFAIYGTYNDFENVLSKKSESELSYLSEFKLFYSQFKANSYKTIHFEFKTIPVLKRIKD